MVDDWSEVNRRRLLRSVGAVSFGTGLAGCPSGSEGDGRNTPGTENGTSGSRDAGDGPTSTPSQAGGDRLEAVRIGAEGFSVRRNDEWRPLTVRGVNLGIGKPGHFPGETAITRVEYDRWLTQLSAMNANAIRVYTVHPPEFYAALAAHNAAADQPLYLFQGTWIPAKRIAAASVATDPDLTEFFTDRLRTVVDVVKGSAELPAEPGYAAGTFAADVSPWLLGYIAGVEWDPSFVTRTNGAGQAGASEGRFVRATADAMAFERWLAERLEDLATYADETYGHRRPMSFANWPTTDHLTHPAEPLEGEDAASVNPNAVVTTAEFDPGVFATYHVYPYYPDFLNFSQEYRDYTASDGEKNSYAGYIADLVSANDHPVLIGEFGVPSSRGIAHEDDAGLDQGHNTETEQGESDAALYETLVDTGTAGGIVFAWQDEWFKRTWNTMAYTEPSRRPYWLDIQSPEERFGLLSFDPAQRITLSGSADEWSAGTTLATSDEAPSVRLDDGYDSGRSLQRLEAHADEAFLYFRISYVDLGDRVDWNSMSTLLAIDTTPARGNTTLPKNLGQETERGVDFAIDIGGPGASRAWIPSHYDRFYYKYGEKEDLLEPAPYASGPDNGVYHPIRLATSYPLRIPTQDRTIPFQTVETGRLRFGTADPAHTDYDSLADVHVDAAGNTVEVRLPWQLLNVRDPSTRRITGDIWADGIESRQQIDDIGVTASTYQPGPNGTAKSVPGRNNVTDSLPRPEGAGSTVGGFSRYTWETWQEPAYRERLKESYWILRDTFAKY